MTNAEKFVEVFGTDLKRQYATKSWWDQEFVPVGKQDPFMNKPCVSHQVCHEDKVKVLEKIRAEIKESSCGKWYVGRLDGKTDEVLLMDEVMEIIDKYKGESEVSDGD